MDRNSHIVSGLLVLLITGILIAGCSSAPPAANQTPATGSAATTAAAGPLFGAGDIVKNPTAGSAYAWLILAYNSATDTYERAFIYSNPDGSWGYRKDARTETADRAVMEKVYTEKITNVPLSSVHIQATGTETATITPTTTSLVTTNGSAITTTVTTTSSTSAKPAIKNIIPDKGDAGTLVSVSSLTGSSFVTGTTVKLVHAGSTDIVATNVTILAPTSLTCTLPIPSSAPAGTWDLVVTNPDGQSGTFTNLFSVHASANPVTTTTTSGTGTVNITGIDPPFGIAHNNIQYIITGSKFQNGATVILRYSGRADIVGSNVVWLSATRLQCFFAIPANSIGNWDVIVTNPDLSTGTLVGGFEVRN